MTHPAPDPILADPLALLRTRTSSKWATYPADVLPMFVAEMDFPLAPQIAARLAGLIGRSDTGYQANRLQVGEAFAGYSADTWDWRIDPSTVQPTTNVVVALTELVRATIEPGDRVLLNSPVYYPFTTLIREAGGEIVDAPLTRLDGEWVLDLEAIEAAYVGGVRVHLLCHPHNPIGLVHPREALERLAELAAEHGVLILSDEIHAPLAHADADFVPYLAVSDAARATGVAVTSGSKAFNIPGLGCAFWIPGSDAVATRLSRVPESVRHRVGQFGAHATIAGFSESREWLGGIVAAIETNRRQLRELVTEHLPEVAFPEPRAGYLAWLDFRALDWGDDPASRVLERGRVALSGGQAFGQNTGKGFARINFACSPEVLEEGIRRIAAAR